jgi:hypothetical protein
MQKSRVFPPLFRKTVSMKSTLFEKLTELCPGSYFLGYTAENSHHLTAKIISKEALF